MAKTAKSFKRKKKKSFVSDISSGSKPMHVASQAPKTWIPYAKGKQD